MTLKTIVVTVSNGFANARKYDEFEVEDGATEEQIRQIAFEVMMQMLDWNYYEKENK